MNQVKQKGQLSFIVANNILEFIIYYNCKADDLKHNYLY